MLHQAIRHELSVREGLAGGVGAQTDTEALVPVAVRGLLLLRYAERQFEGWWFHAPPRITPSALCASPRDNREQGTPPVGAFPIPQTRCFRREFCPPPAAPEPRGYTKRSGVAIPAALSSRKEKRHGSGRMPAVRRVPQSRTFIQDRPVKDVHSAPARETKRAATCCQMAASQVGARGFEPPTS